MARILVTGGSGFLGSNLVRELCKGKDKIVVLAKKGSNHPFLKGLPITRVEGDIRDSRAVMKALKGCDYVYHAAAYTHDAGMSRDELESVNVIGTRVVMECCLKAKIRKVVHVSTIAVLGFSLEGKRIDEGENLDSKKYPYGWSKKLAEEEVQKVIAQGLNCTIANPSLIIGSGELQPLFRQMASRIKSGRIKFTYPGGTAYVAVQDVVRGLMLAMKKGKKGERYILTAGAIKYTELYNLAAKELGVTLIRFELPRISYWPLWCAGWVLEHTMKNPPISASSIYHAFSYKNFDTSKAREELGWEPAIAASQAVHEAIDFYKKQKMI